MAEAYTLLNIPGASLTTPNTTYNGALELEYVTFVPKSTSARDVLLVLRLGAYELVLDPSRKITLSVLPNGQQNYVFQSTPDDQQQLLLSLPHGGDDVELFHGVLEEYGNFRAIGDAATLDGDTKVPADEKIDMEDLRGRFVLMNEDNGEIIGALDSKVTVREDESLREKGEETAPVVVELPEGTDTLEELNEMEVLVRTVPAEERDWMLNSAVFVSHVISGSTTLLESAMSSASSYYIAHSTPSPHANMPSGSLTPDPRVPSPRPPPPPSRTLLLLQSPTTRKHLSNIRTVSGHAVKLSSKTAAVVDSMITRITSSDKGKGRASSQMQTPTLQQPANEKPPLPPRSPAPPAYAEKPPLPPRKSPLPSRSSSPIPPQPPTGEVRPKLGTRARLALSAALVLASLEASSTRLVDSGGSALSAAVSHKYGAQAGENVNIAAGTARNVVLVYVDMRGLGRRAIVKRVAKGWVQGRVSQYRGHK
ncbi:hypothetical protein BV25DRAFT_1171519 [Artomyces pyxidatus]|uniref:Uncharacterized protein n=1 Tax=Artomyces pyxidatus TaxID=48021 RepID=A0ACB8SSD0_9AGAM|nr:hypothetical protein BV25DRAFT_1171519 [Artomyces pyxidatus]